MVIGIVVNVLEDERELARLEQAGGQAEPTMADLQRQLDDIKALLRSGSK